jgi:glycosyltransferase involved in cell wall biosynthesis
MKSSAHTDSEKSRTRKLAIVVSHPIQYYSPWFRFIHENTDLNLKVFYLWNFGTTETRDEGFGQSLKWDVPLLEGYSYEFVPNRSPNPGTSNFSGLDNPSLLAAIQSFAPDAVLSYGYAWKSMVSLIRKRPRNLPIIMRGDSHELVGHVKQNVTAWIKQRFVKHLLHRCNAMLAVGGANKQFYLSKGIESKRIFLAPHCVDNSRFESARNEEQRLHTRSKLEVQKDDVVFLFVGKLQTKKRPGLLVEAMQKCERQNAVLWIVGTGELEESLKTRAASNDRIRFLGFKNQTELPEIYDAADCIVLPSQGPGETWGLVINEAMNLGCVPIVSDHVGCHLDLVRPGENGWVVRAGSVESLTDALRDASSDVARLKRYSERSLEIISDYSYEAATRGLLQAVDFVAPR